MQLHEKYKEKASMFRAKALALGFVGKCSGVIVSRFPSGELVDYYNQVVVSLYQSETFL
jgi:hypothetical protein